MSVYNDSISSKKLEYYLFYLVFMAFFSMFLYGFGLIVAAIIPKSFYL